MRAWERLVSIALENVRTFIEWVVEGLSGYQAERVRGVVNDQCLCEAVTVEQIAQRFDVDRTCGQAVIKEHSRWLMFEGLKLFVEIDQINLPVDGQSEKQTAPADLVYQWSGGEMPTTFRHQGKNGFTRSGQCRQHAERTMDARKHPVLYECSVEHGMNGLGGEYLQCLYFRKVLNLHAVELGGITIASCYSRIKEVPIVMAILPKCAGRLGKYVLVGGQ